MNNKKVISVKKGAKELLISLNDVGVPVPVSVATSTARDKTIIKLVEADPFQHIETTNFGKKIS